MAEDALHYSRLPMHIYIRALVYAVRFLAGRQLNWR